MVKSLRQLSIDTLTEHIGSFHLISRKCNQCLGTYILEVLAAFEAKIGKEFACKVLSPKSIEYILRLCDIEFDLSPKLTGVFDGLTTIYITDLALNDHKIEILPHLLGNIIRKCTLRNCNLRNEHMILLNRLSKCEWLDLTENPMVNTTGFHFLCRKSDITSIKCLTSSLRHLVLSHSMVIKDLRDIFFKLENLEALNSVFIETKSRILLHPSKDYPFELNGFRWYQGESRYTSFKRLSKKPKFLHLNRVLNSAQYKFQSSMLYSKTMEAEDLPCGVYRKRYKTDGLIRYRRIGYSMKNKARFSCQYRQIINERPKIFLKKKRANTIIDLSPISKPKKTRKKQSLLSIMSKR